MRAANIPVPYLIGAIAVPVVGIAAAGRVLLDGARKRTAESPIQPSFGVEP
jgi:hypothetical protein